MLLEVESLGKPEYEHAWLNLPEGVEPWWRCSQLLVHTVVEEPVLSGVEEPVLRAESKENLRLLFLYTSTKFASSSQPTTTDPDILGKNPKDSESCQYPNPQNELAKNPTNHSKTIT